MGLESLSGNYFLVIANKEKPMINVPRVSEITKSKTKNELFLERENKRAFDAFNEVKKKYGYGSPESKAAWKALIRRTRSL